MDNIFYQNDNKFYCTVPSYRSPVFPYRRQKDINESFSYIIDGDGIIWIKRHVMFISPEEDFGVCYEDCCLRECITYIISSVGFEEYMNIKKYIPEHLNAYKEKCYDELLKKYNKIWIDIND